MNRLWLLGMVVLGALFGAGGMWLANRVAPAPLAGGLASHHRLKAATFLAGSRRNPAS